MYPSPENLNRRLVSWPRTQRKSCHPPPPAGALGKPCFWRSGSVTKFGAGCISHVFPATAGCILQNRQTPLHLAPRRTVLRGTDRPTPRRWSERRGGGYRQIGRVALCNSRPPQSLQSATPAKCRQGVARENQTNSALFVGSQRAGWSAIHWHVFCHCWLEPRGFLPGRRLKSETF
jgi:hypothetical protein